MEEKDLRTKIEETQKEMNSGIQKCLDKFTEKHPAIGGTVQMLIGLAGLAIGIYIIYYGVVKFIKEF